MCHVHLHRIIQSKGIRKNDKKKVSEIVRIGIQAGQWNDLMNAITQLSDMGYQSAAASLERFSMDLLNYQAFPEDHWKRIRTTNMLERVNREIKRRVRSIGAFPNGDSAMRLIGSILIDINEEWIRRNRYLTISSPVDKMIISAERCSCLLNNLFVCVLLLNSRISEITGDWYPHGWCGRGGDISPRPKDSL